MELPVLNLVQTISKPKHTFSLVYQFKRRPRRVGSHSLNMPSLYHYGRLSVKGNLFYLFLFLPDTYMGFGCERVLSGRVTARVSNLLNAFLCIDCGINSRTADILLNQCINRS